MKTANYLRNHIHISVFLLLVLMIILSSCVNDGTDRVLCENILPTDGQTYGTTFRKISPTPSFCVPTSIPTYNNQEEFSKFVEIKVTQGPVNVSTGESPNIEYLYKNALVSFQFPEFHLQGRRYINLDDLNDNSPKNSDIIFDLSHGSGGNFFQIYPANYAKLFFSDEYFMDYDSCVNQFPVDHVHSISEDQSFFLGTSKRYCVLTNEGHMAVIYYVKDSDLPNDQGIINFSIVVTVYREKVLSIFTPAPTETPGPSPTPTNKYSEAGLTDEQAKNFDLHIQEFINAAVANDKEAILDMADYPFRIWIGIDNSYTIQNPQEFSDIYDKVFTDKFLIALSKASLNDVWDGSLCLYLNGGHQIVYFTDDGKIREIDNYILD